MVANFVEGVTIFQCQSTLNGLNMISVHTCYKPGKQEISQISHLTVPLPQISPGFFHGKKDAVGNSF